jgi:glycosyltransferase 2 family protein
VSASTLLAPAEPAGSQRTPRRGRVPCAETAGPLLRAWRVIAPRLIAVLVVVFVANLALTQRHKLRSGLFSLRHADWVWLPVLAAASAATFAMAAVALTAASRPRLVFRRTVAVQVAAAFTNRLAPAGLGAMATNVRYLQGCGLGRSDALSTVTITTAAGMFVHICVVITVGVLYGLGGGGGYAPNLPPAHDWPVVGCLTMVVFAGGLMAWRRLAGHIVAVGLSIRANAAELRRRPHDLFRLLAGLAGMTCCHTFALVICVQAFGGGVAFLSIAVVYLAATGLAAAVPTPGGAGALETILAAGLEHAGAAGGAAIGAVLTYRLATFWLPIIPGVLTFRSLRRGRVL